MTRLYAVLASFLGASLMILSVAAVAQSASPSAGAGLPQASVGIGDDDPIAVEALRNQHNLQLVFAEQASRAYLADVTGRIQGAAAEQVLVAHSSGPLFFVTLPTGQYRVDAEYKGQLLSKPARVTDGRRLDLYFYWPQE